MSTWVVTNRATGEVVYAYSADEPTEWPGMEFSTCNHVTEKPAEIMPMDNARWKIYVGAFFDRFGAAKLAVLASADPIIQAAIKDSSVRKYIDLKTRHDELVQTLGYIAAQGHALDVSAILDTEPTSEEIWQPSIA